MSDRRNVYPRGLDKAQSRVHSSCSSASISIESRRPPLMFDGSQLCSVQHTVYKVRELENVLRISAWRFGPSLFSKCVASTRSPIFFPLFSFSVFLFSFFFFRRASAADWSQRRHGVSSALPFSSCACRRLPARQRACSPAWQAAPAYGNARDKCNATRSLRYSAGHPSIMHVSSISFSSCLCALFASAQRTRLAESLRLYDCGDKSRVASRRLPIERFGPILLNITASATTTIYLFPRASPVFPRCVAGEVAISWYRACLRTILFQLTARTWKRSFDVSFTRSFGTCLFVLLLGNDLSKDRDATSSLDESRLESLSWWKFGFGEPRPGVSRRDQETQFPELRIRKLIFTLAESRWFSVEGCPGESRRDRETEKMGSTVERAKVSVARQPTPETSSQTLTSRPEAKSSKSR